MAKVILFTNDKAKKPFEPSPAYEVNQGFSVCFDDLSIYIRRLIDRTGMWWDTSEIFFVEREPDSDKDPNIRAIIYSEYGDCRHLLYRRNFGRKSRDGFHWSMQSETQPYLRYEDWNKVL